MANREFGIWQSDRSYRFKEEAIYNHAPENPGIYELVTFDEHQNPKVVYAGWTGKKTIFESLFEHLKGEKKPTVADLLERYSNLYFSLVLDSDAESDEDMQDLFYAIVQADKPELVDIGSVKPTGRYSQITVKDKSILGA